MQLTSEYNKKRSRLTDIEKKPVVTSGGVAGQGTRGVEEREAQTTAYKTGSRVYCTTWGI